MNIVHHIQVPDGVIPLLNDRVMVASLIGVANGAGSGAGAAVTVAISGLNLPPSYAVMVEPGQDASAFVDPTTKTTTGFTVTLYPRLAANTLAAGTFDVLITA